jgi:hypothetical protein
VQVCGVATEGNLKELWRLLAAAGRRDHLVIEQVIQATATRRGQANRAPIVTPDLSRRIAQLTFAGNDMDTLSEGIHPFSLVVAYRRSLVSSSAAERARHAASDYDLVTAVDTNTSLTDARSLRGVNVVNINFDSIHAEARVEATLVILEAIFGDDHCLIQSLQTMGSLYMTDRLTYQRHIETHCPANPYASFLR